MKEKKATVMDKVRPDLLVPPHIVSELIHLVRGEWQPDLSQQEQLVAHLTECPYFRTPLIILLSAEQEYDRSTGYPQVPPHNLLIRFVTIHHATQGQAYEQLESCAA